MRFLMRRVTGNGRTTFASVLARSWSNRHLVWPSAIRREQRAVTTLKMQKLAVFTPLSYQGHVLVTLRSCRSFHAWAATKTQMSLCLKLRHLKSTSLLSTHCRDISLQRRIFIGQWKKTSKRVKPRMGILRSALIGSKDSGRMTTYHIAQ